jgi:hypothetical protein
VELETMAHKIECGFILFQHMFTMGNFLTKCKLYWLPTYTPLALDLAPNGNFIFYKLNNKGIILNFTSNTNSNTGTELNITEQTR